MVLASQQRRQSSRSSSSSRNSRGRSATGKLVGVSMILLVAVAGSAWYIKPAWFGRGTPQPTNTVNASNLTPGSVQTQIGVSPTPQPGSVQPGTPVAGRQTPTQTQTQTQTQPQRPQATVTQPQQQQPVRTQAGAQATQPPAANTPSTPTTTSSTAIVPAQPNRSQVQAATENTRLGTATQTTTQSASQTTTPATAQTATPAAATPAQSAVQTTVQPAAQSTTQAVTPSAVSEPAASTPTPPSAAVVTLPSVVELPAGMSVPDRMAKGMELIGEGQLVEGRRVLSALLTSPDAALLPMDAQAIRDTLQSVNQKLIFSREIDPADPLVSVYVVKPGDFLSKLARQQNVPYEFLEVVNNTIAKRVQIGQKLKMVKGPFHAVVYKSAYRMDMFADEPTTGQRVFIRSFSVGHGSDNSTPTGAFVVRPGGKVTNPVWVNPQTGEHFAPDDPKNPIGDYWLGLQGTSPETQQVSGYGIHGTIEPDSIGTQSSMGCIRLRDEDIKLVYAMLTDGQSTVVILP